MKTLEKMYENFKDDYDFEMEDDFAPYGDTYVSTGSEPTEESLEKCLEDFKEKMKEKLNEVVDELLNDERFYSELENIIDEMEN